MYLSVIAAVPGNKAVEANRWSGGPAAEHRWLESFFSESPGSIPPEFLYRRIDAASEPYFQLVSMKMPVSPSAACACRTARVRAA